VEVCIAPDGKGGVPYFKYNAANNPPRDGAAIADFSPYTGKPVNIWTDKKVKEAEFAPLVLDGAGQPDLTKAKLLVPDFLRRLEFAKTIILDYIPDKLVCAVNTPAASKTYEYYEMDPTNEQATATKVDFAKCAGQKIWFCRDTTTGGKFADPDFAVDFKPPAKISSLLPLTQDISYDLTKRGLIKPDASASFNYYSNELWLKGSKFDPTPTNLAPYRGMALSIVKAKPGGFDELLRMAISPDGKECKIVEDKGSPEAKAAKRALVAAGIAIYRPKPVGKANDYKYGLTPGLLAGPPAKPATLHIYEFTDVFGNKSYHKSTTAKPPADNGKISHAEWLALRGADLIFHATNAGNTVGNVTAVYSVAADGGLTYKPKKLAEPPGLKDSLQAQTKSLGLKK
jgi:hypothetical protein